MIHYGSSLHLINKQPNYLPLTNSLNSLALEEISLSSPNHVLFFILIFPYISLNSRMLNTATFKTGILKTKLYHFLSLGEFVFLFTCKTYLICLSLNV